MNIIPFREHSAKEKIKLLIVDFFLVLIWSTPYVATTIGLRSFAPGVISLTRPLFALIIMIFVSIIGKIPLAPKRAWPFLALCALMGVGYSYFLNLAQLKLPSGMVSVFVACCPLAVAIIAAVFLKERLSTLSTIGMLVSFGGVITILVNDSFGNIPFCREYVYMIIAMLCNALTAVFQKQVLSYISTWQYLTATLFLSTLFMSGNFPLFFSQLKTASTESIVAIVYLSVFLGIVAIILWSYILRRVPVGEAEVMIYPDMPGSILMSRLVLGETAKNNVWFGSALIIFGLYLVGTGRRKQAMEAQKSVEAAEVLEKLPDNEENQAN